jgi:hypothetical protein
LEWGGQGTEKQQTPEEEKKTGEQTEEAATMGSLSCAAGKRGKGSRSCESRGRNRHEDNLTKDKARNKRVRRLTIVDGESRERER